MDEQLHSPARRLIELRIAHAELDGRIDALMGALHVGADVRPDPAVSTIAAITAATTTDGDRTAPLVDELTLRRLKKQRLALRDEIARLERASDPDEPA
ncbi:hypothetical protein CDL60_02405 [Roseateles noduli]|nr:hypothetical protein CDL60_02405 [Roseateles noduli]